MNPLYVALTPYFSKLASGGIFKYRKKRFPIYTCNPNDPCFDWKRPSFGIKTKDKWVPGIYIYIYIYQLVGKKKKNIIKSEAPLESQPVCLKGQCLIFKPSIFRGNIVFGFQRKVTTVRNTLENLDDLLGVWFDVLHVEVHL